MELISKTEDENDLLYLYSAVIRVVFNDRIEEEEIEKLLCLSPFGSMK